MMYSTDKGYKAWLHSGRWQRLRLSYLTDHPWCEECLKQHRRTPATEVHHRQPVLSFPTPAERQMMMFNYNNLMALCHPCHMLQHDRKKQKDHQKERHQNALQSFIDQYLAPDEKKELRTTQTTQTSKSP